MSATAAPRCDEAPLARVGALWAKVVPLRVGTAPPPHRGAQAADCHHGRKWPQIPGEAIRVDWAEIGQTDQPKGARVAKGEH
jgi:hypothetical protein